MATNPLANNTKNTATASGTQQNTGTGTGTGVTETRVEGKVYGAAPTTESTKEQITATETEYTPLTISKNLTYNTQKKSNEVQSVQDALTQLGYSVGNAGSDGYYGNDTIKAVKQFQTDNNLAVDGITGNNTISALNSALQAKQQADSAKKAEEAAKKAEQDKVNEIREKIANAVVNSRSTGKTTSDLVVSFDNYNTPTVTYSDGSAYKAQPCDYIVEDNNQVLFYAAEDADAGISEGWYETDLNTYMDYVSYYDSQSNQDENQALVDQFNQYIQYMEELQAQLLLQQQQANEAAVEKSVAEIQADLENGINDYSQAAEEAYLQMMKNQQNTILQNNYAGNMGGIGSKQYDASQASYDAQLLTIELEKQAFVNSCNQQITALQAEGRLQDAEILAAWAEQKVSLYDDAYWNAVSADQTQQQIDASNKEIAYNKALTMLKQGFVTADALEALGLNGDDAQALNKLASYNYQAAISALDEAVKDANLDDDSPQTVPTYNGPMTTSEYNAYAEQLANGTLKVYRGNSSFALGQQMDGYYTQDLQVGDYIVPVSGGRKLYWNGNDWVTEATYAPTNGVEQFLSEVNSGLGTNYKNITEAEAGLKAYMSNYEIYMNNLDKAIQEILDKHNWKQGAVINAYTLSEINDYETMKMYEKKLDEIYTIYKPYADYYQKYQQLANYLG